MNDKTKAPTDAKAKTEKVELSNAEKFVKLGGKRVSAAIDKIELIGNLANKSNYEFTESQIEKINAALTETVKKTMAKFSDDKEETENSFSFK